MFAQTFFDMRLVHGDESLYSNVRASSLDQARSVRRFHAHLATVASRREPPLGFFRGFVVERGGDYAHTLDIKKGGIHAIVQMARLYALTCGTDALDTRQRLNAAAGLGAVSEKAHMTCWMLLTCLTPLRLIIRQRISAWAMHQAITWTRSS